MAEQILATNNSTYRLDEKLRQEILQGADNPQGKLTHRKLLKVEKQRNRLIRNHGSPFGCVAQCRGMS